MTAPVGVKIKPGDLLLFLALLLWPCECYVSAPDHSVTATHWAFANIALVPLVAFAILGLHHAVIASVAHCVGDYLAKITIGVGPKLWPRGSKASRVALRLLPINWSYALYTPRARRQRARTALVHVTAAVALIGLLALDVVLQPTRLWESGHVLGQRLAPDVLAIPVAAYVALQTTLSGIGVLAGWKSLTAVNDNVLKARRTWGAAMFAFRAMRRGERREALSLARLALSEEPDNVTFLAVLAELLVETRDPTAFDELAALKQRMPPSQLRAAVVNLWAWEAYMRDETTVRDEACQLMEVLVRGEPENLGLVDTYGHMLLWAAREAAAEPHFARVEAQCPRPSGRASSACGLAIIYARRGDFASARRWLARARELDPTYMLLPRTAALVEPPGVERP